MKLKNVHEEGPCSKCLSFMLLCRRLGLVESHIGSMFLVAAPVSTHSNLHLCWNTGTVSVVVVSSFGKTPSLEQSTRLAERENNKLGFAKWNPCLHPQEKLIIFNHSHCIFPLLLIAPILIIEILYRIVPHDLCLLVDTPSKYDFLRIIHQIVIK